MERVVVNTPSAPPAIGPYSQAVRAGHLLFTAGQIGMDPATQTLVPGGIEAETRQVLSHLQAILAAAGASPRSVVKTTIYLIDMADFQVVNQVYAEVFSQEPPARSTVAVAALPRGARVEIEAVAIVG